MNKTAHPAMRHRLAVVVSSDMTIKAFLLGHLRELAQRCELCVVANTADLGLLARERIRAELRVVPIVRPIKPWADLRALSILTALFSRERLHAVISVTPKAGLLSMLAAFVVRTPVRIHIFTGQVWATRSGLSRTLFKAIDRLVARLATHVLVDGNPQRQFLIEEGVVRVGKSRVLGSGSLSGVDPDRFKPDPLARELVRDELGVNDDALLFLYVGRLNRDKGVLDLAQAFARLAASAPRAHLLMVGPDEGTMRPQLETTCAACVGRVHFVGYTNEPERYMAAADVFCLPSYREGFPTSVLEAAASGIPTIASRIYGIADAVLENDTGLMHEPGAVEEIRACMQTLLESPELRNALGTKANQRVLREFSAAQVTDNLVRYVLSCLAGNEEPRKDGAS